MKSEQTRMKSSAYASDEIKSAYNNLALARFHRFAISSTQVDLFRIADLVEKTSPCSDEVFSGGPSRTRT